MQSREKDKNVIIIEFRNYKYAFYMKDLSKPNIYITIPCIQLIPIARNFRTISEFVNSAFFLVNSSIFLVNCPQFLPQVDNCFLIDSLSSKVPWANKLYARFLSAEKNKKNMRIKRLPNKYYTSMIRKLKAIYHAS